jgi:hypothetical protein
MRYRRGAIEVFQFGVRIFFIRVIRGATAYYTEPFQCVRIPSDFLVFHGVRLFL